MREFLGSAYGTQAPDHSTISRTRQRIALEAHKEVFAWVVGQLREAGLAAGLNVVVDATTLAANAALSSLRRMDSGED